MRIPLHLQIVIGMLIGVLGACLVLYFEPSPSDKLLWISNIKPIGDIFLRLIYMCLIPLIFSALVLGINGFGKTEKLNKTAWQMLKFTIVASTIAVIIGIVLVLLIHPGSGLSKDDLQKIVSSAGAPTDQIKKGIENNASHSLGNTLVNLFPKNPFEDIVHAYDGSYTGGGMIAIIVFSIIIGIAMVKSPVEKIQTFKSFLEGLYTICMKVIQFGMILAPIGVASLLFVLTLNIGISFIGILFKYLLLVIVALLIQEFVVFGMILKYFSKCPPRWFFKNIRAVMLTAFSTSSGSATLPIAIEVSSEQLKMPKDLSNFILTIGTTSNQAGTAIYQGITIIFLAQCFGIDLNFVQILAVVGLALFAGIGTIGVPGGSMPVLMLILIYLGIPAEAIAIIYGLDRILDMCRTVVNVSGDLVALVYINNRTIKT